jgi:hypothetical protein
MLLAKSMFAIVLGGTLVGGCAMEEVVAETERTAELTGAESPVAPAASAFTLSVSSEGSGIRVIAPTHTLTCADFTFCQFAYVAGTAITVKPRRTTDQVDCIRFSHWEGACAGQSSNCQLVVNSDLSTHAVWVPLLGCRPL